MNDPKSTGITEELDAIGVDAFFAANEKPSEDEELDPEALAAEHLESAADQLDAAARRFTRLSTSTRRRTLRIAALEYVAALAECNSSALGLELDGVGAPWASKDAAEKIDTALETLREAVSL